MYWCLLLFFLSATLRSLCALRLDLGNISYKDSITYFHRWGGNKMITLSPGRVFGVGM